ncbi:MAG: hypothetical protein AAGA46_00610 [Cyanobacteria bacterium P01_F01_bin.13]
MNAAAIARHLNIAESAIVRCEEWANVVFCVVRGLGARFVSKKIVKVTRSQVANQIASAVKKYDRENYQVKVWVKAGRCRLYVKDLGYSNAKAQDRGYFSIGTDGALDWSNLKSCYGIEEIVTEVLEGVSVVNDLGDIQHSGKNESWENYHKQHSPKEWHFGAADEESF